MPLLGMNSYLTFVATPIFLLLLASFKIGVTTAVTMPQG